MALPLPAWFGPRAVLEEVEKLVLQDNDNNAAAQGWTRQEIRESLMQTHQQNQQELPPEFNARLRATLARLRNRGHLMTGAGTQRYTLSSRPPYFPPWFGPQAVMNAVGVLDGINGGGGGSTWPHIRNALLQAHQPPQHQQPPPDFDRLLRAMLSVLRERGHLAGGTNGPQHYTRQQAPAPAEPNPIDIPNHLWCYYLGYDLGFGVGLAVMNQPINPAHDDMVQNQAMSDGDDDDDDSDDEMDADDA